MKQKNRTMLHFISKILFASFILLTACSTPTDDNDLVNNFSKLHSALSPIATLLSHSEKGSIIDLRDDEVRIFPDELKNSVTTSMIHSLRNANITFATHDSMFNGILFETESSGIGISGSSSGYIYQLRNGYGKNVDVVENIQKAFSFKKSQLNTHESLNIRLVKRIDDLWGVYLETF